MRGALQWSGAVTRNSRHTHDRRGSVDPGSNFCNQRRVFLNMGVKLFVNRRSGFNMMRVVAAALCVVATACSSDKAPTEPTVVPLSAEALALIQTVRQLAARQPTTLPAPPTIRPVLAALGKALAFDRELSGTRDISCMTCHHPAFATGDGRSLSVGSGGTGLGPNRLLVTNPVERAFIARNAPSLFNLSGQRSLFHDGRVEQIPGLPMRTPAGAQLTADMSRVFEFGALSALSMFPVTDRDEMRGQSGNDLAGYANDDFTGIWGGIMRRLGAIAEYRTMFEAAYPGTPFDQMTFAHASNAIAGFMISEFAFRNTPWDNFLGGNDRALSEDQVRGANTFLTQSCATCHVGAAFSDGQFHNVGIAQIGPGKGNGATGRDDYGRFNVTWLSIDIYRFRTPSLRNVELTAPYGHAGQIATLSDFVNHYDNPGASLQNYSVNQLEPALRGTLQNNFTALLGTLDPLVNRIRLSPRDVDEVSAFLRALTDPAARNLSALVPARVPSGLAVDR